MIEIVGTLTQIEVDDADGVHLLYLVVLAAQIDMFCNRLGYTIENTLQIIKFACLLNLNDDNLIFGVLGLDVDAIELVFLVLLVSLTLQYLDNPDLFVEQYCHQSFEHIKVSLVAKHALHRPIKSYILHVCHRFFLSGLFFFCSHNILIFD